MASALIRTSIVAPAIASGILSTLRIQLLRVCGGLTVVMTGWHGKAGAAVIVQVEVCLYNYIILYILSLP